MDKGKLERLIFKAIGEASVCWIDGNSKFGFPQGKFDTERASKVADKLLEDIIKLIE